MDNTVRLWDAMKAFDDIETDDFTAATGHIHLYDNSQELLLGSYNSKSTSVVHLHFTRRNLLLAAGMYNSQWWNQLFLRFPNILMWNCFRQNEKLCNETPSSHSVVTGVTDWISHALRVFVYKIPVSSHKYLFCHLYPDPRSDFMFFYVKPN